MCVCVLCDGGRRDCEEGHQKETKKEMEMDQRQIKGRKDKEKEKDRQKNYTHLDVPTEKLLLALARFLFLLFSCCPFFFSQYSFPSPCPPLLLQAHFFHFPWRPEGPWHVSCGGGNVEIKWGKGRSYVEKIDVTTHLKLQSVRHQAGRQSQLGSPRNKTHDHHRCFPSLLSKVLNLPYTCNWASN